MVDVDEDARRVPVKIARNLLRQTSVAVDPPGVRRKAIRRPSCTFNDQVSAPAGFPAPRPYARDQPHSLSGGPVGRVAPRHRARGSSGTLVPAQKSRRSMSCNPMVIPSADFAAVGPVPIAADRGRNRRRRGRRSSRASSRREGRRRRHRRERASGRTASWSAPQRCRPTAS